jgi:hypothetical protein
MLLDRALGDAERTGDLLVGHPSASSGRMSSWRAVSSSLVFVHADRTSSIASGT